MDSRKLQALLTTLRTGSFSKAALELNCSQSAVTQMMNSLEAELGCKVLSRTHNGIGLTPAGEALLPLVVEAEACLTHLLEQARAVAEGSAVPIRLGSFSSVSNIWLPAAIKDYQKEHPSVTFNIRIGTDTIPDWLHSGEIDIALADAQRCKRFRWYPLMDDPYCAVLPRAMIEESKQVISQEELSQYPFIMSSLDTIGTRLTPPPTTRMTVSCDDSITLLSMVAQGLGVTAMSRLSLQDLPSAVRVLELRPPIKRVMGVALPNSPRKAAKDFCDFLRKRFPYQGT